MGIARRLRARATDPVNIIPVYANYLGIWAPEVGSMSDWNPAFVPTEPI